MTTDIRLLLQLSLTIFLFSISVPTIVYAPSSDDIKTIIHRYRKTNLLLYINISSIGFIFILLWSLNFNIIDQLNIPFLKSSFIHAFKNALITHPVIPLSYLSSILLFYTYLGIHFIKHINQREHIIQILEHRILYQWNRNKKIMNIEFDDLTLLGILAAPGYNKQLILNSHFRIIRQIIDSSLYDGDQISHIINRIEQIIINDTNKGDKENFYSVKEIYRVCFNKLIEKNLPVHDYVYLIKSVERISLSCINNPDHYELVTWYIELPLIKKSNVDHFLSIGKRAIELKYYDISLTVYNQFLNYLKVEMTKNQYCNYLGFISYFLFLEKSTEKLVINLLKDTNNYINLTNVVGFIRIAMKYFQNSADFSTVNQLKKFEELLYKNRLFIT